MDQFKLYFQLGHEHILDIYGFDHILFVIALCAIYMAQDWKKVLILVTAFTIGHSITLALSTFELVNFRTDIIEFLIPVTIFITAFSNIIRKQNSVKPSVLNLNYFFALFFGLIHGLGFSNYLKSLLGKNESIITQLLAFNLGLELGQILIVVFFMIISFVFTGLFRVSRRDWNLVVSSAIAGIAITMMIEMKFW
ncbi:HupE/UreJ family protein [uncultured Roseivirga sp.]|jgi:ABC-type antimicrobial peptide transport system permease subunit|uniref:HupE/UreJ family protein n=1 Tax=uncultured Roseivirga sp. TaxID=543088 RepID=UPI0030DC5A37|tara:strand:- start:402441 stop:403025 length:585 start_codon:yes stop_codon:yes gene_type:complete